MEIPDVVSDVETVEYSVDVTVVVMYEVISAALTAPPYASEAVADEEVNVVVEVRVTIVVCSMAVATNEDAVK